MTTDFEFNSRDLSTLICDDRTLPRTVPIMFKIAYHYASRGSHTFVATKYHEDFKYLNREPYNSNHDHLRKITLRYFKTAEDIIDWCSNVHYSNARKPRVLILHGLDDYVSIATPSDDDNHSNNSQQDMFEASPPTVDEIIRNNIPTHMEVCGALCEAAAFFSYCHKIPVPLIVISKTGEEIVALPFTVFFKSILTHEEASKRF